MSLFALIPLCPFQATGLFQYAFDIVNVITYLFEKKVQKTTATEIRQHGHAPRNDIVDSLATYFCKRHALGATRMITDIWYHHNID